MKVLTITAPGINDELQPYHIINPINIIVTEGEIERPGNIKDGQGNLIPIKVKKTFVHVGGKPIFASETPDEILAKLEKL